MKKLMKLVSLLVALFITACGPSAGRLRLEAQEAEFEREREEMAQERFESEMEHKATMLARESGYTVPFMLSINDIARRCNNNERCVARFYSACRHQTGGDQTPEQQNAMARCLASK